MPPISQGVHIIISCVAGIATILFTILSVLLEKNLVFLIRRLIPSLRVEGGRPPNRKPKAIWILYLISAITMVIGLPIANAVPDTTSLDSAPEDPMASASLTPEPSLIPLPPTETLTINPTFTPTFTHVSNPGVGSTWVSSKDGMVMMFVPAGNFIMGDTVEHALSECQKHQSFITDCQSDWFLDQAPSHDVYLDAYWIDKTEVTNAMYSKCVDAGICNLPSNTVFYGFSQYAEHPVALVSWSDSKKYCEWRGDGSRLPTEAEWEKAASWDDSIKEKRVYPWGDFISCSYANYAGKVGKSNWGGCIGETAKVGSYPSGASFYGLLDMAGNVWEWVSSLYKPYPYVYSDGREDLMADGDRVLRGGAYGGWDTSSAIISSSYRFTYLPFFGIDYFIGFRCARSHP